MNHRDIRTLYAYNSWANKTILDTAEQVPAEHFTTARLGYCNLRDGLAHLMDAEVYWLWRWQGSPAEADDQPGEFRTLAELRARWSEETHKLDAFVASLSDADLEREEIYHYDNDTTGTSRLWHMMMHLVNHGTHHRGELALLLTELGHSPGELDFLDYVTVAMRGQID